MLLSEKRLKPRVDLKTYIDFSVILPNSEKKETTSNRGIIKNIGLSGLFFETAFPKRENLNLLLTNQLIFSLEFKIPTKGKKISTKAELRWLQDPSCYIETHKIGCGVKFQDLDAKDHEYIQKYIKNI